MHRTTLLLFTLFFEGGLYVVGLFLLGGSGSLREIFSISWGTTFSAVLLSLPMFAVLYFTEWSESQLLSQLRNEMEEKVVPIFANCNLLDLALIAMLAGVGEELFFRGWLQHALASRFGIALGILIASAIFGLAHYLSFPYAIYALVTGIYLGVIYHMTGNLYLVMIIHGLYDFIALMYLIQWNKST